MADDADEPVWFVCRCGGEEWRWWIDCTMECVACGALFTFDFDAEAADDLPPLTHTAPEGLQ